MKRTIHSVLCSLILGLFLHSSGNVDAASFCQCVEYARCASGIRIYGNANQWDNLAASYGYRLASHPMIPGVMNFEAGAYGSNSTFGHVAVPLSYYEDGSYWVVRVRHSNWGEGTMTDCGCTNVSEKTFRVPKYDPSVHYIYDPARFPPGPYSMKPGVSDLRQSIGASNPVADDNNALVVNSEEPEVTVPVRTGQRVVLRAKAEFGEKIWVLIESSRFPGILFVKPSPALCSGDDCLVKFSPEIREDRAEALYYSKKYGDTVIDLGSADYTGLGGFDGEVTINIKKGNTPQELKIIQTIKLKVTSQ